MKISHLKMGVESITKTLYILSFFHCKAGVTRTDTY
jgi:hypothetical protein